MTHPTNNDIQEAKAYIRRRLEAELSMEHYLDSALVKAAKEIVNIAYKRNIPASLFSFNYDRFMASEIDEIIRKLVIQLEEYDYLMALSTDKADNNDLIPYINREINGITYTDRMGHYVSRFKLELQDFIAAGLVIGLSESEIMKEIRLSYKKPYNDSIISDRPHRGQGAYSRLLVLTRHTIADAWMYADMEQAIRMGAIGFYSFRGSSYHCQLCDDMANRFHTFAEPYPPYHPSCMCYAVPIYK